VGKHSNCAHRFVPLLVQRRPMRARASYSATAPSDPTAAAFLGQLPPGLGGRRRSRSVGLVALDGHAIPRTNVRKIVPYGEMLR
jgi:hypothetical protein